MRNNRGQTLTESVVWAPFFFAVVFLGLQICHIGFVMIMTNYAASSLIRRVVEDPGLSSEAGSGKAELSALDAKFKELCTAGMKVGEISAEPMLPDGTPAPVVEGSYANSIRLTAYSTITPFPMMATLLNPIFRGKQNVNEKFPFPCIGPICLEATGQPKFWIRGRAYARLNYH